MTLLHLYREAAHGLSTWLERFQDLSVGAKHVQSARRQIERRIEELERKTEQSGLPAYPDVIFDRDLRGPDGNIFFVIGHIRVLLRQDGADEDEIEAFTAEVDATKSYDDALRVCGEWVVMPERVA